MLKFKIQILIGLLLTTSGKGWSQLVFFMEPSSAEKITAATYDFTSRQVLFFSGNSLFFYPFGTDRYTPPQWFELDGMETVDAAVNWNESNALLFEGTTYRMFELATGALVSEKTMWPGFPPEWKGQLDAAVRWDNDMIIFFLNNEYLTYSLKENKFGDRSLLTAWEGWPQYWTNGIDDAFNGGDGYIYFLRAGEMMPYSLEEEAFFQPRKITTTLTPVAGIPPVQPGTSVGSNTILPPGNRQQVEGKSTPGSSNPPTGNNAASKSEGCTSGAYNAMGRWETTLAGDPSGTKFADAYPPGQFIRSIKVFTTRIWGKTVIAGLETTLENANGSSLVQPVVGKRTLSEQVFTLQPGECLKGISGSMFGPSGQFIYSIRFITTQRTSQIFGEKTTENGRQSFEMVLPNNAAFNGFIITQTSQIASVGMQYNGEQMATAPQSTNPVTGSNAKFNPAAPKAEPAPRSAISGGYRDDYEDYTKTLGDDAMWSVQPMPGLDWLGAGFDILRYDPLNPNDTRNRKQFRAVVITSSSERAGNKAQYLKPFGCNFGSVNYGSDVDSSAWVSSYQTFANSFGVGATGSVSIPSVASASLSGSYSEMNSVALGSESLYYFSKIVRKIHELDVFLTWQDQFTGEKYRQKLHPSFRADVATLPLFTGAVDNLKNAKADKGKNLPGNLESIKAKYLELISKYGTHFAHHVTWGGQYISRTEIKRSDFEKARLEKTAFMNSAEVTIKKVTVGRQVEFDFSSGSSSGTSKSYFRRQTYVQGGNGETDLDKWRDKVDLTPAPVQLYFISLADLLTPDMFPEDKDIVKKGEALRLITEKYLVDNMRPPVASRDDFFRPLPDLPMPGQISVKNEAGYVMRFSLTFESNGKIETKNSGDFTLGRTFQIDIPENARKIKLKVEYYKFINTTGILFEEEFSSPVVKCFKAWGTVFSPQHAECK